MTIGLAKLPAQDQARKKGVILINTGEQMLLAPGRTRRTPGPEDDTRPGGWGT
ncbi:hypothetical protein AB0J35_42545 [Nonomuraea angiospora]|uniref:hypothetical protein n=1 Tax=Nonomuraea angiospora TaxID=46172 RepID=UPI003414FAE3